MSRHFRWEKNGLRVIPESGIKNFSASSEIPCISIYDLKSCVFPVYVWNWPTSDESALSESKEDSSQPVPRGTSLPYPGLSSVALIYVLVSDVTRVRRIPGVVPPCVCTKDPPSYYPGRSVYKWPKLGLIVFVIGTGNILRPDLLSLPLAARLVFSRPIASRCKIFAWPSNKTFLTWLRIILKFAIHTYTMFT